MTDSNKYKVIIISLAMLIIATIIFKQVGGLFGGFVGTLLALISLIGISAGISSFFDTK